MDAAGRSELFQAGQSFGRFYLVQLIGEGGTSRIFKAMQQPINRIVALKIPTFTDAGSILTPDEFLSEATLMARLEHGHVVRIYDFGVHEDSAFICMEYVEGWNLLELTEARGALPVSAVLAAAIQTLDGLLYAHSRNVLHLDLSPANVLISRNGSAKLSDFGMAGKKFKAAEGRIVGTPAFLSPEHVAGSPGTPQSDLFSFGSLLYFAATGEPLFDPGPGNSRVTQAIREIEAARGRPPEDRLKRLPRLLAKPVLTALESKDPQGLLRELREAYKKVEGEERPEAVLRRELELDGDPLAPGSAGEDVPSGQELRDRYVRLREGGKHREAVALLEKALRKQPDNPLLRELLATPPAKAKSAPVTVDVGASSQPSASGPATATARNRPAKSPVRLAAGVAGLLAMTVALLGWNALRNPGGHAVTPAAASKAPPASIPQDSSITRSLTPATATQEHTVEPASPGSPGSDSRDFRTVALNAGPSAAKTSLPGEARGAPAPKAGSRSARRPPAVAVSGPRGTKVTVDDTLEWIAPGPAGGKALSPGLVNITLTPPGSDRPISSSLFISEDTLYLLNLEADGGFSVNRKRR
jgi:serine/threonine protein kinase